MFGTIRKHQTWLWGIIIVGTVVSFVIYFSPNARFGMSGGRRNSIGSVDGQSITPQQVQRG